MRAQVPAGNRTRGRAAAGHCRSEAHRQQNKPRKKMNKNEETEKIDTQGYSLAARQAAGQR